MAYRWIALLTVTLVLQLPGSRASAQPSVARQWDDELLKAIRVDTPRPTVHARNLFHTSVAMYDAWAAYDPVATGYLTHDKLATGDVASARNEAISFAAYRVLSSRFANSPGKATILPALDARMSLLGYDKNNTSTVGDSPAAVGNRIAAAVLAHGLTDGSNEAGNYADLTGYIPANAPLDVSQPGTTMVAPNRWQPLKIGSATQRFLTPQWGDITTFGMTKANPNDIYHDPGAPPLLGTATDAVFRQEFVDVIRFSSKLSPVGAPNIDISPGALGNNSLGSNAGTGHPVNPATGQPYAANLVNQGDFGRVMAEFWADGPKSETPPGHWNVIFNDVSASPLLQKKIGGSGATVDNLEWDVKGYLALNGALHNAAITAWDIKQAYDCLRPISAIRYMGSQGQSSDPNGPSYHPNGLPLETGLVEVITAQTTAPGQRHAALAGHEGKIAIVGWLGHPADPQNDIGGTGWMLAEEWLPYQRDTFVTPAFPGFTSGHSTFSRAGAEVLTALTGSEFFPGGLMEYILPAGTYLSFENGPSQNIRLQYATYFDAADGAGQSRLWGGIHVLSDDFAGRIAGAEIGKDAWAYANRYFVGQVPEPSSGLLALLGILPILRRRTLTRTRAD